MNEKESEGLQESEDTELVLEEVVEVPVEEGPQVKVKEQQIFHFDFLETEVNLILRSLGELPTKQTFTLVNKILFLVRQQNNQTSDF